MNQVASHPVSRPIGFSAADDKALLNRYLERAAEFYHAQAVAWHHMIAQHKPENLWGMIHVSDAEISAMLNAPFRAPGELPEQLVGAMTVHWDRAEAVAREIAKVNGDARQSRIAYLQSRIGLSGAEIDLLMCCLLPELDERYRRLVGYLLDDATRTRPSLDLMLRLIQPVMPDVGAARLLLSHDGVLRRHQMLRLGENGHAGETVAENAITLDPRIVDFILGADAMDKRLAGLADFQPAFADGLAVLDLETEVADRVAMLPGWIAGYRANGVGTMIHLSGAPDAGQHALAASVASESGRALLTLSATVLPGDLSDMREMLNLAIREALLRDCDLFVGDIGVGSGEGQDAVLSHLAHRVRDTDVTVWSGTERPWYPCARVSNGLALAFVDLPPPSQARRQRLWSRALPDMSTFASPAPKRDVLAGLLTDGFQLNAGQIDSAVRLAESFAVSRNPDAPVMTVDDIYEACRRQAGDRLVHLARRVEPVGDLTFEDLALRPESLKQIDELRARIRLRNAVTGTLGFGRRISGAGGFTALFTGTSGTGKTMAAQLMAREQGVDLYKIDLSAIVSKYVGETEKNLERIFTEAEDANALLFFDEADSLFGKRGDVKEARDRWANLEVNYLLQRVEDFNGVVILATNLRQNIDEAFLRRIHAIVEFPFPDAEMRAKIWLGMFPPGVGAPAAKIVADLAERFELAGGSIRNVTLDAAFRALADSRAKKPRIGEKHLVAAVCREYLKLGKPVTPGEFGERYYAMVSRDILGDGGGR